MSLFTPEYLQTRQYSALRDRLAFEHGGRIQAGVWDPTDLKVSQRAAGATMTVDVGAGFALVPANSGSNDGLYHVQNDAVVNVPITAAHATLPRIDQLVLTVNDSVHGGASSDVPLLTTVDGVATSGATIDNRTGAAALPSNTLRLADIFVGAAVTSITTTNIRDRRPWARGARWVIRNPTATNYALTSTSFADIDATNLAARIELGGIGGLIARAHFSADHSVANGLFRIQAIDDGGLIGATTEYMAFKAHETALGLRSFFYEARFPQLPAGSHRMRWRYVLDTAGTLRVYGGTLPSSVWSFEEDLRPSGNNGTT